MSASRPDGLGLVGHQLDQHPTEPDGLRRQVGAHEPIAGGGGVALGEDQVDRGEDDTEPIGQLGGRRDPVGGVVVAQLALRPDDPLGDGRLRHDERAGDLGGVEAAQQSQGERHLGVGRQRRMAAQEHQAQLVVGDHVRELIELASGVARR